MYTYNWTFLYMYVYFTYVGFTTDEVLRGAKLRMQTALSLSQPH